MKKIALTLFTGFLIFEISTTLAASSTTEAIKEDAKEAKVVIKTEAKKVKGAVKSTVNETKPKVKAAAGEVKQAGKNH